MSDVPPHGHIVNTGKGELTLDELARAQPGMAEIMLLIGGRIWKCYYAGKAKNQPLARFQLKEAVNLLKRGAVVRPKYADNVAKFLAEELDVVRKAIEDEDWATFETAFAAMVDAANDYHVVYNVGYLVWKVPDQPPPDLDFTPRP